MNRMVARMLIIHYTLSILTSVRNYIARNRSLSYVQLTVRANQSCCLASRRSLMALNFPFVVVSFAVCIVVVLGHLCVEMIGVFFFFF